MRQLVLLLGTVLVAGCASADSKQPADRRPREQSSPAELVLALAEGTELALVLIPAGEFAMGSPADEPGRDPDEHLHRVCVSRSFYMSRYEITQEQWGAVIDESPSRFQGKLALPVDSVTWEQAQAFCRRLSDRAGRAVRLPTEAEWEYACRAGTTTPFAFGDTLTKLDANHDWTGGVALSAELVEETMPVGSFAANAWGLHDMHGNVREWCSDWYGGDYYRASPAVDPAGPAAGAFHVLRGGAWEDHARRCRSAYRHGYKPGDRDECIGLRVCVDVPR